MRASTFVLSAMTIGWAGAQNNNPTTAAPTTAAPTTPAPSLAPTTHAQLPDCVCRQTWVNNDGLCDTTNPASDYGGIVMRNCPSLTQISLCDVGATVSYCETTTALCKQQYGSSMVGQQWAYCNPNTDKPELPPCTCKSKWKNTDKQCHNKSMSLSGCPTVAELKLCDPDYDEDQSWCETNEKWCQQQENADDEKMEGRGWAYCDAISQETELPACECKSSWTATTEDCTGGVATTFSGCPTGGQMKGCDSDYSSDSAQTWCETTRSRCREQTVHSDGTENMINNSWAYCSPKSGEPELPECECKEHWVHNENKCAANHFTFSNCPSASELLKCDYTAEQSWCETTFESCKQQNYESDEDGWSYCDSSTGMGEYALCECEDVWYNRAGDCAAGVGSGMKLQGCPTLEELQQCDSSETTAWCDSKDARCKGQVGDEIGQGWFACDVNTQGHAETESSSSDVTTAIATSVVATLVFCALFVTVGIYVVRRYRYELYSYYAGITPLPNSHELLDTTA